MLCAQRRQILGIVIESSARPHPKPAASPSAHLTRLVEELDWLRANVGKLPGVTVTEAADVRGVVIDLAEWARLKVEAAA